MQGFSRQRSRKNTPRCTQRANAKNFVHKLGFCGVICSSDLHIVNMHNTDAVWSVCARMPSAPHRRSRDSVSCGVKFFWAAFLCHKVSFSQFLSSPLPLFFSTPNFSVWRMPVFPFCGGSWLGGSVVLAEKALFNLGADCQKWKTLDTLGTQRRYWNLSR